ncbi:ATP-binding protein [Dactylosporangium cerinum]|uniref:ATP-binding protein n=1 Tax=Dactylosporangium cerinum TaxID=1434730 RepID=A0ABV9WGP9_9ACTN
MDRTPRVLLPEGLPEEAAAQFRGRVSMAARSLLAASGRDRVDLSVGFGPLTTAGPGPQVPGDGGQRATDDELDLGHRMSYFTPVRPSHRLDQLVLPKDTLERLHIAVDTVRLRGKVFDEWGLRSIEQHPRSAINLHGAPGTGKTLAAHALADHLRSPILLTRTSQLESKYHGEGGKYLAAMFEAARRHNAVIFMDEAESMLSRRFESVSQGSEHATNTLRTELIQHLDAFEGLVIFATNLAHTYDPAFQSRLQHVHIPMPDYRARVEIWRRHLPDGLPGAKAVPVESLARIDGVVGRDIQRAVIEAAVTVAREQRATVTEADLTLALRRIIEARADWRDGDEAAPAAVRRQRLKRTRKGRPL